MKKISIVMCIVLVFLMIIEPMTVSATFVDTTKNDLVWNDANGTITVASGNTVGTLTIGKTCEEINIICDGNITKIIVNGNTKLNISGSGKSGTIYIKKSDAKLNVGENIKINTVSINCKNSKFTIGSISNTGIINNVKVTLPSNIVIDGATIKNIGVEAAAAGSILTVDKGDVQSVGYRGKGTLNVDGGEINGGVVFYDEGTLNVNGGEINSNVIFNNTGTLKVAGGKINGNVSFLDGGQLSISETEGVSRTTTPITGLVKLDSSIYYSVDGNEDNWEKPMRICRNDLTNLWEGKEIVSGSDDPDKWQLLSDDWKLERGQGDKKNIVVKNIKPNGTGEVNNPYLIADIDNLYWLANEINGNNTNGNMEYGGGITLGNVDKVTDLKPDNNGGYTGNSGEDASAANTTEPESGTTAPELETTDPETGTTAQELETTDPETEITDSETDTTAPELETTAPQTETTDPETETTVPEPDTIAPETDPTGSGTDDGGSGEDVPPTPDSSDNTSNHAILTADIDINPGTSFNFNSDTGLVKVTDGTNTAYLGTGIKGTTAFQETASVAGTWYEDEVGTVGTYKGNLRSWTPIGDSTHKFTGSFDGNGHTISGLYVNNSETDYVGLFGLSDETGEIKNLAVEGGYINGHNYVSGICGSNDGEIQNCYNNSVLIGNDSVGGVCGCNNTGSIESSYNTGSIMGNTNVGELCGDISTGTIKNSYYLAKTSEGMGKTADEFASGLVTRLLNGGDGTSEMSTGTWGQTIGTDSYPVFADINNENQTNAVYKVAYSGVSTGSYYINHGDNLTLDEQYKYVTADGQAFNGENITEDISGIVTSIRPKYTVSLTSRVDSSDDSTTVALLTGGGEFFSNKFVTVTAPEKEGYEFKGWYMADDSEQGYTGQVISNNLSYTFELTEDVKLVAVYTANSTVKLSITGTNFTVNDGENQTTGSYEEDFKVGTKIKLVATGENFAYWMNSSKKIISTSAEYEFTLVGDTEYTPVYKNVDTNSAFVEFVSDYGQIVQAGVYTATQIIELPEGPSKIGYEFTGWSMNVKDIQDTINEGTTTYIKVNPMYEALATKYTVTVNYIGTESLTPDLYDDLTVGSTMTLKAKEVEGKKFSHWASDAAGANVLGTSESYFMAVTNNLAIYAVYVDEESIVDKKPVIAITDTYTSVLGTKNRISFCATRDVPEGYTVEKQGIIYGTDSSFTNDTMVIGGTNVRQYVSSLPEENKVVILNVNVGSKKDLVVYARGYLVAKNNKTGNIETYYTEITSRSFNN